MVYREGESWPTAKEALRERSGSRSDFFRCLREGYGSSIRSTAAALNFGFPYRKVIPNTNINRIASH